MTFAPLLHAGRAAARAAPNGNNSQLGFETSVAGTELQEHMNARRRGTGGAQLLLGALLVLGWMSQPVQARPVSSEARARLAAGRAISVIVEYDVSGTDRTADAERTGRHLRHDDAAILAFRASGYATTKRAVERGVAGPDATKVRDYEHIPVAAWRLTSLAALGRLEAYPGVRAVHQDLILHPVSVSDLSFINQPQVAAAGATGAGTTIAVIDGGLADNYLKYPDFGDCTAVGVPTNTCRVVFNKDYYSGAQASTETVHGTNVSAIALGVAPAAKLAMLDVFQGSGASSADIIDALNTVIKNQAAFNIVAVNLSLGDGSSYSTQCTGSVFASAMTATLNAGILPVVAAGNSGAKTGLADPACVPGVASVGAVYDASYGTVTWVAASDSGGQCSDASAADHVTCFSQSASYLSVLAPGTFVNAPTSAFQESGTSQATPHIAGTVAVLHSRYQGESPAEILKRIQISGVIDTDSANGRATPRLDLAAALSQPTAVALSGSGPTQAVATQSGTYSLTITNSGPLDATDIVIVNSLPGIATFASASKGCTYASNTVTCAVGTLAVGASVTVTINVTWNASGPVYDSAAVTTDQRNSSPQGTLQFGNPPPVINDAPLPLWAFALLAIALLVVAQFRLGRRAATL
jgi:uncharacterized repeat protein (TIGR01451 family)